nr:MAG: hypothetical protein [Gammatorquevirus sp.]
MSFMFKPSKYNNDTKQQLWMSIFADSHDSICCCETPFAHALQCMFPEGHKDRHLTVDQIITRDLTLWHSGGTDEENHGLADTEQPTSAAIQQREEEEEDILKDEEIEELIAAADDAVTR